MPGNMSHTHRPYMTKISISLNMAQKGHRCRVLGGYNQAVKSANSNLLTSGSDYVLFCINVQFSATCIALN